MPNGRCRMHGGTGGRPIEHGRYSKKVTRPRIAELLRHFAEDPEPLNLLQEVHLLRSLVLDYIERYDEFTDALVAWNESFKGERENPKPVRVLDVADAAGLVDRVGRMVERIEKIRAENAVSQRDLVRVLEEYARVVKLHVEDEKALGRISRDWASIRL